MHTNANNILYLPFNNHEGGVIVSILASSAVDRGLEPLSGQTKEYKIGIGCFSANLTASGQLLHLASNINIQVSGLF